MQLRISCERLQERCKSLIFNHLWHEEAIGSGIDIDEHNLFEQWQLYVNSYDRAFEQMVQSFANQTILVEGISRIFGDYFHRTVNQPLHVKLQLREFQNVQFRGEQRRALDTFE